MRTRMPPNSRLRRQAVPRSPGCSVRSTWDQSVVPKGMPVMRMEVSSEMWRRLVDRRDGALVPADSEVEPQDELQYPAVRGGRQAAADAGIEIHALPQVGVQDGIEGLAVAVEMAEAGGLAQLVVTLEAELIAGIGLVGDLAVHVQGYGAGERRRTRPVQVEVRGEQPARPTIAVDGLELRAPGLRRDPQAG